jgi:hypothetical protein
VTNTNNTRSTQKTAMTEAIGETSRLVTRLHKDHERTKLQLAATRMMIADSRELLQRIVAARQRSSPAED